MKTSITAPKFAFPTADPLVGWGRWTKGEQVTSFAEFKTGERFLMASASGGGVAHNIVEVLSATKDNITGKPVADCRMIEPKRPSETRAGSTQFRLRADEVEKWQTSLFFRAIPPAARRVLRKQSSNRQRSSASA